MIERRPLCDPARERSAGVEALSRSGPESVGGCRRGIAQEANSAVEDVASGEESTEHLGVVCVQPITAKLEIVFAANEGEVVPQLRAPDCLVNVGFQEKRIADAERGREPHRRVRRYFGWGR